MQMKFNKKIYNKKALKRAITDFRDFATFQLETNANYYIIRTAEKINTKNQAELSDEFGNYALGLLKK